MEISHRSKKMKIDDVKTLPEDLIQQSILPRLPVKSAIRFQLVSKTWYAFIKHPLFTRLQLSISRNRNPRTFLILSEPSFPYPLFLNSVTVDGGSIKAGGNGFAPLDDVMARCCSSITIGWEIVGVCAGVVCLAHKRNAVLWNPAIGVTSVVRYSRGGVDLGNRVLKRSEIIGFGCLKDGLGNVVNFKLLMKGEEFGNPGPYVFLIYSLNIGEWLILKSPNFMINMIVKQSCVKSNGILHWLAWGDTMNNSAFLLTFDIANETFGKIKMPKRPEPLCLREYENYLTLFEDRHIMLVVPMEHEGEIWLDRWILFKGGKGSEISWRQMENVMGPLAISGTMLGYWDGVGVIAHDRGNLCLHAEGKVSKCPMWYPTATCLEYAESLVSPKRIADQDDFQKID